MDHAAWVENESRLVSFLSWHWFVYISSHYYISCLAGTVGYANCTSAEDWDYTPLQWRHLLAVDHPHHQVVPPARISLTLSRHFSLSFIAFGRSSGLHPVSSHSCCMYVRAGRPAFVWPYAGVHRSTSLMSSSLLLQQCPACLVRLTCIVFMMGGKWPYSWCV